MRVTLINPYFQSQVHHIAQTTIGPPLGLAYVAGGLEEADHDVVIVDANVLGLDPARAAERALTHDPNLVGLTATTPTLPVAAAIAREVKARRASVRVVVGGPHASAIPRRTLDDVASFDGVAVGEGDRSLAAWATAFERHGPAAAMRVPGFVWRDGDDVVSTGAPPPFTDLETVPSPARHLLPMDRYRTVDSDRFTTVLAMRGCPCSCVYCAVPEFFGRRMRYRAPASVAMELDAVHRRHGIDFISFVDDTFTTKTRWVNELCDELIRRGVHRRVRWICLTRADMVDVPLLRRMRDAGCVRVEMSIETGSDVGRAYLRKGLTEAAILRGYAAAREVGLSTMGFLILNIPGETEVDVRRSLDLALRADPDFLQVSFLTPYPGTPLRVEAEAKGWIGDDAWEDYSFLNHAILRHGTLPPDRLAALHAEVISRFWLRPRTAIKLARLALRGTAHPRPLLRTICAGLTHAIRGPLGFQAGSEQPARTKP